MKNRLSLSLPLSSLRAMRWLLGIAMTVTVLLAGNSRAATLDDLKSDGYQVVYTDTVSDAFNGCDYGRPVPLENNLIFICHEYNYDYAYRPSFYVLEKNGDRKYVIDHNSFDGELYRGTPIYTYVTGSFDGCEQGKMIALDNGLVFQCRTYHYHYEYRPKVMIVGDYVTIGGEKYDGQLYRR
jgi:hypothetical protein